MWPNCCLHLLGRAWRSSKAVVLPMLTTPTWHCPMRKQRLQAARPRGVTEIFCRLIGRCRIERAVLCDDVPLCMCRRRHLHHLVGRWPEGYSAQSAGKRFQRVTPSCAHPAPSCERTYAELDNSTMPVSSTHLYFDTCPAALPRIPKLEIFSAISQVIEALAVPSSGSCA